jgi:DNA-binding NarL/FixJ family response regulator
MDREKDMPRIDVCLLSPHFLALREMRRSLPPDKYSVHARALTSDPALDEDAFPAVCVYVIDIEGALGQIAPGLAELIQQRPDSHFIAIAEAFNETNTFPILRLGFKGIIEHAALERQIVNAIETVTAGGYWVPRIILSDFVSSILKTSPHPRLERSAVDLSRRESEVLEALLNNRSNKEIANHLSISERTVKFHVSNVLRKFRVGRRADLILLGTQMASQQQ